MDNEKTVSVIKPVKAKIEDKKSTVTLTESALTIVKLKVNDYRIVKISFDFETGRTSEPLEVAKADSKMEAHERFKIAVAKEGILS